MKTSSSSASSRRMRRHLLVGCMSALLVVVSSVPASSRAGSLSWVNASGVRTVSPSPAADAVSGPALTVDEVRAFDSSISADPAEAARDLVTAAYGQDRHVAAAAVAVMLTRSGVGLLDSTQTLVALPHHIIADELIPVSEASVLAEGLAAGQWFDADQISRMLNGYGILDAPLSSDELGAVIRAWGKDDSALPEGAIAGDIVRELSARHGPLPVDGVEGGMDSVQMLLLLEQISGQWLTMPAGATVADVSAAAPDPEPPTLARMDVFDCAERLRLSQSTSRRLVKIAVESIAVPAIEKFLPLRVALTFARSRFDRNVARALVGLGAAGTKTATAILHYLSVADVVNAIVESYLLLTGMTIDVIDDHGGRTHFRHQHGDSSTDVLITALVNYTRYSDPEGVKCVQALGIDIPQGGPVDGPSGGWQVLWRYGENVAPNHWYGSVPQGAVLRPEDPALQTNGHQPVDAGGMASFTAMTRTERDQPNAGGVHEVGVDVIGTIDRAKPPSLGEVDSESSAVLATIKLAIQGIGFPSARHRITVGYHGQDAYVAQGHGSFFLLQAQMTFSVDAYSCDGPAGPWNGSAGWTVDGPMTEALARALGYTGPGAKGSYENPNLAFTLPDGEVTDVDVPAGENNFGLQMTIDNPSERGEHIDGHVGTGTWLVPGKGEPMGDTFDQWFGHTTFSIRGVPEDPHCPAPTMAENPWD